MDEKQELLDKERALLVRIRRGETSAWGQLYDVYAPMLYRRILMPRLANSTAADDALAETFRTAIEKFGQYKDQPTGIYPWLGRIAHNKAMDMHRAAAVTGRKLTDLGHVLAPLMEQPAGPDQLLELRVEKQEMSGRMDRCLGQLNERYREVLELRFLQERSRQECADALEVKIGTLDVLVLRAVRALKKTWDKDTESG